MMARYSSLPMATDMGELFGVASICGVVTMNLRLTKRIASIELRELCILVIPRGGSVWNASDPTAS